MKHTHSLEECYLFSQMSGEDVAKAIKLLSPQKGDHEKGDIILSSLSFYQALYFIASGTVKVTRTVDFAPILLNQVTAGNCFGVASLFGGEKYPTTVIAKSKTTLYTIREENLKKALETYPQMALNHIRFLSDRIRFLNDKIDSLTGRSSAGKLAKFLLEHADGEGHIQTALNMKQVAASLDIGRASLYRLLSQMERESLISMANGCINICDKPSLERLVNPK